LAQRQGIVLSRGGGGAGGAVAHPILVDGRIYGTVAVTLGTPGAPAAEALRQLQWGTGWLDSLLRREQGAVDAAIRDRTARALDVLAVVLEQRRFEDACAALVTELAARLDCSQVAIGFLRRRRARVAQLSHAS